MDAPAPPRRAVFLASGLLMAGALLLSLAAFLRHPYAVNPTTVVACRAASWAGLGLGPALLLAGAWLWLRRERADLWLAGTAGGRLLLGLVLLYAAGFVALPAAEAGLRPWMKAGAPDLMIRYHPTRHHAMLANESRRVQGREYRFHLSTNSLGMRGPEPRAPKGSPRILLLGNCFTEGVGVEAEETFCARMQALLTPSCPQVEVVNGGCASYSPLLEWRLLQETGPALRPDLVVLLLDCGNIADDFLYTETASFAPDGDLLGVRGTEAAPGKKPVMSSILSTPQHSALCTGMMTLLRPACAHAILSWGLRPPVTAQGDLHMDHQAVARVGMRDRLAGDLQRSQGYLLRVRDLSRSLGAGFVLVTYPWGHQVNEREWMPGRLDSGFLPGEAGDTWMMEEMRDFGAREGFPVADLTEEFRRSGRFPLYYPRIGQWTPAGHAVAAEGIVRALRASGLVPP